jgi:hypothetical protein
MTVADFAPDQIVQAHPGTDTWMRGDRFGRVDHVTRLNVYVRMFRSGRLIRFAPENLLPVEER